MAHSHQLRAISHKLNRENVDSYHIVEGFTKWYIKFLKL